VSVHADQMTTLERKIGHFSRILESKPGDELTVLALAEASFRRGLKLEALTAYQEVVRSRAVPEAYLAVAEIYSAQDMPNEAYGELRRLFELDPDNVEARLLVNSLQEDALPPEDVREIMQRPTSEQAFDEARLRLKIQRAIYYRELQERTRNVTLEPGVVIHEYHMEEAKKKLIRVDELLRELERFREYTQTLALAPRPEPVSPQAEPESVASPPAEVAQEGEPTPPPMLDELPQELTAEAPSSAELAPPPSEEESSPAPSQENELPAPQVQTAEAPSAGTPSVETPLAEISLEEAPSGEASSEVVPLSEGLPEASAQVPGESASVELAPSEEALSPLAATASPETAAPEPLPSASAESEMARGEFEPSPVPAEATSLEVTEPADSSVEVTASAEARTVEAAAEEMAAPAESQAGAEGEAAALRENATDSGPPSGEGQPAPHLDLSPLPIAAIEPPATPSFNPEFAISMDSLVDPDLPDLKADLPEVDEIPDAPEQPSEEVEAAAPPPPVAGPPTFDDAPPVPEPVSFAPIEMIDDSTMILTAPEPEPIPPVAPVAAAPPVVEPAPAYSSGEMEAVPQTVSAARQAFYETHAEALSGLTTTLARTRGVTSIFLVAREGVTIDSVVKDDIGEKRVGELVRESFEFLEAFANDPAYWVLECAGGIFVMQKLDDRHVLIAIGQAGANFGALRYTMDKTRTKFEQLLAQAPA
jgi:tetratricopeptide (TPR) repeat protein/predicted regulator of Ras-like GTPase activity (Roadblock/LC7/MglB family)